MGVPTGRSYGVFAGNVPFLQGDYFLDATHENIVADAGGVQSTAVQLNGQICHVITAANANAPYSGVQLPPWTAGMHIRIYNDTLNNIQVFPHLGDSATINDGAVNGSISQMPNSVGNYTAVLANGVAEWHSPDAGGGYASGTNLPTYSFGTIAANSTATQASGTAITSSMTNVTSAAAGPYSVTLPVSQPGLELVVHNISAYSIYVFPNAGGTTTEKINALSANAAITMLTNTSTTFTCLANGQWYTVPRVPS